MQQKFHFSFFPSSIYRHYGTYKKNPPRRGATVWPISFVCSFIRLNEKHFTFWFRFSCCSAQNANRKNIRNKKEHFIVVMRDIKMRCLGQTIRATDNDDDRRRYVASRTPNRQQRRPSKMYVSM